MAGGIGNTEGAADGMVAEAGRWWRQNGVRWNGGGWKVGVGQVCGGCGGSVACGAWKAAAVQMCGQVKCSQ